jgi:hypothetical protein
MPYSAILELKLFVKEYLNTAFFTVYRTLLSLHAFNLHFDFSPHCLNVGTALGALEVFIDH